LLDQLDDLNPVEVDDFGLGKRAASPLESIPKVARIDRQLPEPEWLSNHIPMTSLRVCCIRCGGEHKTTICQNSTTIDGTTEPQWVEFLGGSTYKEKGTGRDICFYYNLGSCNKVEAACCFGHSCSLCGGRHRAKACHRYHMTQLVTWYRSSSVPPPAPLVLQRYALQMAPPPDLSHPGCVKFRGKWMFDATFIPAITPNQREREIPTGSLAYDPLSTTYPHLPMVEVRTHSRLVLTVDSVVSACPSSHQALLSQILDGCSTRGPIESFKTDRAHDISRTNSLIASIQVMETALVNSNMNEKEHFTLPNGIERGQLPDGSPTNAPLALFLHYPSSHDDKVLLTPKAFATNLIRQFGFDVPSSTESSRLSCSNVFPMKCTVDSTRAGILVNKANPSDPPQAYPKAMIDVSVRQRGDDLWGWYSTGSSKVVALFGRSDHSKDLLDTFISRVELPGQFQGEVIKFSVEMPILEAWEKGLECGELVQLREESRERTKPFPRNESHEPLFATNSTFASDHRVGLSSDKALHLRTKSSQQFYLAVHPSKTSGILFLTIPHPQACLQVQDVNGLVTPQLFDHALNFLKAIHDGTDSQPRTVGFHGSLARRKAKTTSQFDLYRELADAQQASRSAPHRMLYYHTSSLPLSFQSLVKTVSKKLLDDEPPSATDRRFHPDDVLELVQFALAAKNPSKQSGTRDPNQLTGECQNVHWSSIPYSKLELHAIFGRMLTVRTSIGSECPTSSSSKSPRIASRSLHKDHSLARGIQKYMSMWSRIRVEQSRQRKQRPPRYQGQSGWQKGHPPRQPREGARRAVLCGDSARQ
jgi:hypothetical protein